jgi:hypothetical protein
MPIALFKMRTHRCRRLRSGAYLAVKVDRLTGNKKKGKSARVLFGRDLRANLLEQDPEMDPLLLNRKVRLWCFCFVSRICLICCFVCLTDFGVCFVFSQTLVFVLSHGFVSFDVLFV